MLIVTGSTQGVHTSTKSIGFCEIFSVLTKFSESLTSSTGCVPALFLPFPSDLRNNFEKNPEDCDGEGVVRELADTCEEMDDPDTSRILCLDSTFGVLKVFFFFT